MTDTNDDRPELQRGATDTIRSTLAAGFAFVRGRETTASLASITFEENVSKAIADINEDESDIRVSKLTRIRNLKQSVVDSIDQARQMSADLFTVRPGQGSANTDVNGDGPSGLQEREGRD